MSYDVRLDIVPAHGDPVRVGYWSPTYNLRPMFVEALTCANGLMGLDGMRACEALGYVNDAIALMRQERSTFEALAPDNGWGSYEGCVEFLREFRLALEDYPSAVVSL